MLCTALSRVESVLDHHPFVALKRALGDVLESGYTCHMMQAVPFMRKFSDTSFFRCSEVNEDMTSSQGSSGGQAVYNVS